MKRHELLRQLFPEGIPKLWCPPLTYFRSARTLDSARIEAHLQKLSAYVGGLLVPGSTGEGWEMRDQDIDELLGVVIPIAQSLKLHVSVGILKTTTAEALTAISKLSHHLCQSACAGITVCAAKGSELSQSELTSGLAEILSLGIPTSLYQLPQVTQNELQPATVQALIERFENIILFKDTSGEDRVANSGIDTHGVFMVRGAERGGYSQWLKSVGGNYDGFLLSTANCFAPELSQVIQACERGDKARALQISQEISTKVTAAFELVANFTTGNAFTNANKVIDHIKTYGANYAAYPSPVLYSGVQLPIELMHNMANKLSTRPHPIRD